jgi:hypothetical protein
MTDNNLSTSNCSAANEELLDKPTSIVPAAHTQHNGHGHHSHSHGHGHRSSSAAELLTAGPPGETPGSLGKGLPACACPCPEQIGRVDDSGSGKNSVVTATAGSNGHGSEGQVGLGQRTENDLELMQQMRMRANQAILSRIGASAVGSASAGGMVATAGGSASTTTSSSSPSSSGDVIRKIDLEIAPSIGESFQLAQVNYNENVVNLKKIIINKLKLQNREQITLLYREKVLLMGLISDYGICHGSRLTLLPSIETGLLTQRPEQSVLEALEGLNETQINDFLSGKSPLNLTMRLGEHVMLIQLQLSKGQALAAAAAAASHSHRHSHHSSSSSSKSSTASSSLLSNSSNSHASTSSSSASVSGEDSSSSPTLAEASRNLTKTLKRISSKVNKVTSTRSSLSSTHTMRHHRTSSSSSSSAPSPTPSTSRGEIKGDDDDIINLKHHGKGVYSGTFSGTLNPALQDSLGTPRKHVSTIVHILNDLLGTIDLRSGDSIGEVGLKSASIGTSNSLKRKKTSPGSSRGNTSSSSSSSSNTSNSTSATPGHLLAEALASECTDSEDSHDSVLTKPVVALKLQKMSSKDGDDGAAAAATSTMAAQAQSLSKDEENRLLRLKIEKLKENLLARKLKRNS